MKQQNNETSDRDLPEPRIAECVICDGYGCIAAESEIACDWCDGYGRVTESQLEAYLTPPDFEDWKFKRELRAIDE